MPIADAARPGKRAAAAALWMAALCSAAEWDTSDFTCLGLSGSEENVTRSSLKDCQQFCEAAESCRSVHWFEQIKSCYHFKIVCPSNSIPAELQYAGVNSAWYLRSTLTVTLTQTAPQTVTMTELLAEDPPDDTAAVGVAVVSDGRDPRPEPSLSQQFGVFVFTAGVSGAAAALCLALWQRLARKADPPEPAADDAAGAKPAGEKGATIPPHSWQKGKLLGRGSFGRVYLAHCDSGAMLAVKVVSLGPQLSRGDLASIMNEVKMLAELRHETIVACIGCRYDCAQNELQIFMEYMPGGSLGALVRKLGVNLKESTAVLYMRQILNGVAFMHSRGVLHRDIKGDNILLAADGTVKLGDLGACGSLQARMSLGTNVGTPLWMAPEVISRAQSFSTASDVWALGIVAVEVLNQGRPPWPAYETSYQALYAISKWARPLPPDVPGHLGESCLSFLRHCHDPVPASRLSASELLRHAWLDPPAHAPRVPDDETGLAAIVESDRDLRFLYEKNRAAVCCCTAEEPSTEELSTEYADAFGGSEAFSAVSLSLRRGSSTMANSAGASDSTSLPLLPR